MEEVEFHTGVADRIGFACRLLRKAYRRGVRMRVTAPPEDLAALDRALWVFEEREFLPHVRVPGAPAPVAARTPIWLSQQVGSEAGAPRVLLNLGAEPPQEMGALERLIEVVGNDPDEVERGRERWRAYKQAGLQIRHHAAAAGD